MLIPDRHIVQRRTVGEGSHFEIRVRHEVEISEPSIDITVSPSDRSMNISNVIPKLI